MGRSRHWSVRPERGAATLAEAIVAMVLAALLLGVVTVVASSTEHVASLSSAGFASQRSAAQVLSSALNSISDASPLGACEGPNGPVYTTALSACTDITQGEPALVAANSGSPDGLCWYSYPNSATGVVAPDLRCLVAYPDGELWAFDWPPSPQATYTNCDPDSCFGPGAPLPGQLPPEPNAPGDVGTLAGEVSQPDPITFYDQDGQQLNLTTSSSQAELGEVYRVDVTAAESWGAGSDTLAYGSAETYTVALGQSIWQGQQQAVAQP